jgi:hypothetical protein
MYGGSRELGVLIMRYFTRHWYDTLQELASTSDIPPLWSDRILTLWSDLPERSYLAYLDFVWAEMSEDVRLLAECYLHDFCVCKVVLDKDTSDLSLELRYESKRHPKETTILFSDVDVPEKIADIEGCYILHYEIAVRQSGTYEFSTLLDKAEFSIKFRRVRVVGAVKWENRRSPNGVEVV